MADLPYNVLWNSRRDPLTSDTYSRLNYVEQNLLCLWCAAEPRCCRQPLQGPDLQGSVCNPGEEAGRTSPAGSTSCSCDPPCGAGGRGQGHRNVHGCGRTLFGSAAKAGGPGPD